MTRMAGESLRPRGELTLSSSVPRTGMHLSFRIRRLVMKDGKELEAVVMAGRTDLDKVRTILKGTAKAYRVMCVELDKEGSERIPGSGGASAAISAGYRHDSHIGR